MIGRISGTLIEKDLEQTPPCLLIDVAGVGYELQAPLSTFYHLPEVGQAVTLCTHFVVREDAQVLYAFASKQERTLFRCLIKVNGVGPKLALTILSSIEPQAFVQCVNQQNVAALVRVPGIGKKTAERLMIEMRDRLKDWQTSSELTDIPDRIQVNQMSNYRQEAQDALVALGYKAHEAAQLIKSVTEDEADNVESLIRVALKQLASA